MSSVLTITINECGTCPVSRIRISRSFGCISAAEPADYNRIYSLNTFYLIIISERNQGHIKVTFEINTICNK